MENTPSEGRSQAALPEKGRFTAEQWATILGRDAKYLKERLKKLELRYLEFGTIVIVDAAWFWNDLIERKMNGKDLDSE